MDERNAVNCMAGLTEQSFRRMLTKSAFMITGHAATFGDTSEDHNPHTKDGRRKHVHCVELGLTYKTATEASRATGVNSGNLHQALHGRLTTAGGYHWIYVDPEA